MGDNWKQHRNALTDAALAVDIQSEASIAGTANCNRPLIGINDGLGAKMFTTSAILCGASTFIRFRDCRILQSHLKRRDRKKNWATMSLKVITFER